MIENDVKFSKFLILRVETAWPTWMALCRNVRMSVPYTFDRTWRRSEQTETVDGSVALGVIRQIGITSLNFWPTI